MEITNKRFIVINPHPISTPPPTGTNTATALALGNNGRREEEEDFTGWGETLTKIRSFPKFPFLLPFAFKPR